MSVRAYRVKDIVYDKEPTFNLWHDEELMKLIGFHIYEQLNEAGGIAELSIEDLKEALKEAKGKDTKEKLRKMVKQARENEGWVQYYCF